MVSAVDENRGVSTRSSPARAPQFAVMSRGCAVPVTLNPNFCLGYKNLGLIHEQTGNTDEACKQFGKSPMGKKGSCTACKAGYNCKSPHSYEPAPALVWLVLPIRSTVSVESPSLLSFHSPDGLWRPPRLI